MEYNIIFTVYSAVIVMQVMQTFKGFKGKISYAIILIAVQDNSKEIVLDFFMSPVILFLNVLRIFL